MMFDTDIKHKDLSHITNIVQNIVSFKTKHKLSRIIVAVKK